MSKRLMSEVILIATLHEYDDEDNSPPEFIGSRMFRFDLNATPDFTNDEVVKSLVQAIEENPHVVYTAKMFPMPYTTPPPKERTNV